MLQAGAPRRAVQQFLRDLAATSVKATFASDSEAVIQSKTKDKALMLDNANMQFTAEEVHERELRKKLSSKGPR